MKGCGQATGLH